MEESRVYLKKTAIGQLVEASLLDEVSDKHLVMWSGSWQAAMQAHCAGRLLRDKPEDHHWNWQLKAREWRPMLGYHSFAITCEGELQGLMLVSDFKSARIQAQFGKPIVYIEFLATAPWNGGASTAATFLRCWHGDGSSGRRAELEFGIQGTDWTSFPVQSRVVLQEYLQNE